MASIAARVAAYIERYGRWASVSVAPTAAGTPTPGVPILVNSGVSVNLAVEIAWGANPFADQSTWTWTDVTTDVMYAQKITITPGRQDETSTPQPASCGFTLLNVSGAYSQGGQSRNYPNVKRGVPVRVRAIYNSVSYVRFQGYVAEFTPAWDTTGTFAVVRVTAAGVKRRYAQNQAVEQSTLTRAILATNPINFWPLEDGSAAAYGQPAVGPQVLNVVPTLSGQLVQWAGDRSLPGAIQSVVIPGTNGATLEAAVLGLNANTSLGWSAGVAVNISAVPPFTDSFAFGMYNNTFLFLEFNPANTVTLFYGSASVTSAAVPLTNWNYFCFDIWQNGTGVQIDLWINGAFVGSSVAASTTMSGLADLVLLGNPPSNTSISHLAVWNGQLTAAITNLGAAVGPVSAFNGEYVRDRLPRLASEQGEFISLRTGAQFHQLACGPQQPDTYINLVETAAKVDGGVLYDGFAQGLSYISHDELTSQPAAVTLDASVGQLADEVAPIDDDQLTVNSFTASRTNGSTVTYTDSRSSQNPNAIGTYGGSDTIECYSDGQQLADYASWKVNLGTYDGYRYPTVELWLHRNPELLLAWLSTRLASRIDISNLIDVRTQLANGTLSQLLEGYTETIDQFTWSVTANCTPYDPWRAAEWAQTAGDTNPFVFRVDTDGSTTVAAIHPGDATCQVNVNAGTVWSTNADDFPVDLNIGGWQVSVTGISGSSSPQTLSLSWYSPLPTNPIPAGASVSLWHPTVVDVLAM